MDGRGRLMMERERMLYEASVRGNVDSLNQLLQEDGLVLARASVTCFDETPLHVAVMQGHVEFGRVLLSHRPGLVTERDSQGRSPLHLASANGCREMVKMLVAVDSDVCLLLDGGGRTPLHLAAMKGRVEAVKELARARPQATRYTLDHGETVLHSCVLHGRLEALKPLVDLSGADDFLNFKDDYGNTILHTATALKQLETVKYLVSKTGVRVNAVNGNAFTALDIIEQTPRDFKAMEIRELLAKAGALRSEKIPKMTRKAGGQNDESATPLTEHGRAANDSETGIVVPGAKKHDTWLKSKRNALMVVATVIASMAYQGSINPPGGVWQEDKEGQVAGTAILADVLPGYWLFNTLSFVASISIIFLLMSGLPLKKRFLIWLLLLGMWVTIASMTVTYVFSIIAVSLPQIRINGFSPAQSRIDGVSPAPSGIDGVSPAPSGTDGVSRAQSRIDSVFMAIALAVPIWLVLMAVVFLGHTCRFIFWIFRKLRKLGKRRPSGFRCCE